MTLAEFLEWKTGIPVPVIESYLRDYEEYLRKESNE